MTLRKYWLTKAAEDDLSNIASYTLQTWGVEQLDIYQKRLENRLTLLLKHPEMGRSHPMLRNDFRYIVEGRHYIFYREVDEGIEILRFLHCRCDLMSKLAAYI